MEEWRALQREIKDAILDLGLQEAPHTDLDLHIRAVELLLVPDHQLGSPLEDKNFTNIVIIVAGAVADEDKEGPNTNPHFGAVVGQAIGSLMSGDPKCSRRKKMSAKRDQRSPKRTKKSPTLDSLDH